MLLLSGHSNIQQIQSRNTLKDAIIIIQSILLVIFISVPMLLFLDKVSGSISSSRDVLSFATASQAGHCQGWGQGGTGFGAVVWERDWSGKISI